MIKGRTRQGARAMLIAASMLVLWTGTAFAMGTKDKASEPKAPEPAPMETKVETKAETKFDLAVHQKAGFALLEEQGRLWVFREGSEALERFLKEGEPARQVIRPGAGINGVTLKAVDTDTLDEYITTLPGFVTIMDKGRMWVFVAGSPALAEFREKGEPVRQVIRPGAGPFGMTLKAVDAQILDDYMTAWEKR